jgi:hypothetical protein
MDTDTLIIIVVIGACVGLPLILAVWALRKFSGTTGSIKGGLPAQATIVSLAETGLTVSSYTDGPNAPVYKIGLQVTPPGGGAPYQAVSKHEIPRIYVPMVLPGATIGVLVDPANPQHVVPDWSRVNSPLPGGGAASAAQFGAQTGAGVMQMGGLPFSFDASGQSAGAEIAALLGAVRGGVAAQTTGDAAQLLATGTHGRGVIDSAQPMGKTLRDIDPSADAARLNDPIWLFTLDVTLAGQAPFQATFGHRVPLAKVTSIAPGVKLAVAVDPERPTEEVAIDWDRSPIS